MDSERPCVERRRAFFHLKIHLKSPFPPLLKGGIPLFGKEGLGEIFIIFCDGGMYFALL